MECYDFYRQFEDYFKTVRAKSQKHIFFVTFFSKDRIFYKWQ